MERREGRAAFRLLRPRRAAESHVRRIQTCATSLRGMTLRTALTVLLAVGLMPLWGERRPVLNLRKRESQEKLSRPEHVPTRASWAQRITTPCSRLRISMASRLS